MAVYNMKNMSNWKSKNRHKYLLQYHIIFVCKYRKQLLTDNISDDIKQLSYQISQKHCFTIREMETDKDHIHYMIEAEPTIHIWERYEKFLYKHFWKERTFWTDGYFACSIGNVSENILREYIRNQG